jgi:hypothetical protein
MLLLFRTVWLTGPAAVFFHTTSNYCTTGRSGSTSDISILLYNIYIQMSTIKTSILDYNGERYLSSIINCVILRL